MVSPSTDAPSTCVNDFLCEYFEWDSLIASNAKCRRICDSIGVKDATGGLTEMFTGLHSDTCQSTCSTDLSICDCHLRDPYHYSAEVQVLIDGMKASNWQVQYSSLLGVQYTAKNYPLPLTLHIGGVFEGIVACIENLRSGLSKNGIITAGHVVRGAGKCLTKDIVSELLSILVRKAGADKRFVAGAALDSCKAICSKKWGCSAAYTFSALSSIISEKSKNAALMAKAAEVLWFAVEDALIITDDVTTTTNFSERQSRNDTVEVNPDIIQSILPAVSILVVERLPAAKEFARKCLSALQSHWNTHFSSSSGDFLAFVHNGMKMLPDSQRAALFKAISQIRYDQVNEGAPLPGRLGRSAIRVASTSSGSSVIAAKGFHRSQSLGHRGLTLHPPGVNASFDGRKETRSGTASATCSPQKSIVTTSSDGIPIEVFVPSKSVNNILSSCCKVQFTDAPKALHTPDICTTRPSMDNTISTTAVSEDLSKPLPQTSFDSADSDDPPVVETVQVSVTAPTNQIAGCNVLPTPRSATAEKAVNSPSSCPAKLHRGCRVSPVGISSRRESDRVSAAARRVVAPPPWPGAPVENKLSATQPPRSKRCDGAPLSGGFTRERPPVFGSHRSTGQTLSRTDSGTSLGLPRRNSRDNESTGRSSTSASSSTTKRRLHHFATSTDENMPKHLSRKATTERSGTGMLRNSHSFTGTASTTRRHNLYDSKMTSMELPGRSRGRDVQRGLCPTTSGSGTQSARSRSLLATDRIRSVGFGSTVPSKTDDLSARGLGGMSLRGGGGRSHGGEIRSQLLLRQRDHFPVGTASFASSLRTDAPPRPPRAPVHVFPTSMASTRMPTASAHKEPKEDMRRMQTLGNPYNQARYGTVLHSSSIPSRNRNHRSRSQPPPPHSVRWRY